MVLDWLTTKAPWHGYMIRWFIRAWHADGHSYSVNVTFLSYLDPGEGDSRGGVGADHQRHNGGAQSAKHIGELQGQREGDIRNTWHDINRHTMWSSSLIEQAHLDFTDVNQTKPVCCQPVSGGAAVCRFGQQRAASCFVSAGWTRLRAELLLPTESALSNTFISLHSRLIKKILVSMSWETRNKVMAQFGPWPHCSNAD